MLDGHFRGVERSGEGDLRLAQDHPDTVHALLAKGVGLWGVNPAELGDCFPEFRPWLGDCRYADCRHRREPGCPIREAVEHVIVVVLTGVSLRMARQPAPTAGDFPV